MKITIFASLFLSSFFLTQTNDSLAVETPLDSVQTQNIKIQEVKISENQSFIYQKPKFWDIVNKIPKNIAGTATDIVCAEIGRASCRERV